MHFFTALGIVAVGAALLFNSLFWFAYSDRKASLFFSLAISSIFIIRGCDGDLGPNPSYAAWSGKDELSFLLRTPKRIAARIPLETCSPGWSACAPPL